MLYVYWQKYILTSGMVIYFHYFLSDCLIWCMIFFYCRRWPESQIPWFSIYCSVINLHVQWSLSIQSIWLMVHIKAKMLLTEIYSNFWCWHEVSVFSVYHYSNRGEYFSLKSRNCPNLQNAIHKLPYIFSLLWSFLVLVVQCWFSEMFC